MAPAAVECRVRRLRRLQQVVEDPGNHEQWLAAHCGQLPAEVEPTLLLSGHLGSRANPWARRVLEDVQALEAEDDASWLVGHIGGRLGLLLTNAEVRQAFAKLDVAVLRARCFRDSVPPPGWVGAALAWLVLAWLVLALAGQ
eukprot:2513528-Lingulodinium_polyedra.AAC.1